MKVFTWNTLHRDLAKPERYGPGPHLNWSHRLSLLQSIVAEQKADVVLLQEVDPCTFEAEWSEFFLVHGWTAVTLQPQKAKKLALWRENPQPESRPFYLGLAILFRHSDWSIVPASVRHASRDLLCRLEHRHTKVVWTVINLHLPAKLTDAAYTKRLHKIRDKVQDVHAVIAGDFNCYTENSLSALENHEAWTNAYEQACAKPTVTYRGGTPRLLDYVYTRGCSVSAVEWLEPHGRLPSATFPSDHVGVSATLYAQ